MASVVSDGMVGELQDGAGGLDTGGSSGLVRGTAGYMRLRNESFVCLFTCLKKGWVRRVVAEGLWSGCCCRHCWTRLWRVAEWFFGPGLCGLSVGGAVALWVMEPVATLSPIPESTPERDTFRPPSSPKGKGATSSKQQ